MFSYTITCPGCAKEHIVTRAAPYERVPEYKMCQPCLDLRQGIPAEKTAIEFGGTEKRRCGTCVHFGATERLPGQNFFFRGCGKGYVSEDGHWVGDRYVYSEDICEEYDDGREK